MSDTRHPSPPPEPDWVAHAIWWRVYPLGFVGALPAPEGGAPGPEERRLRRLIPWLDHVVELGASGIALGPIFASDTHGYDVVDHFRVDPRLGDDSDVEALFAAAHERGLRVQLDGVFNHVGRRHPLVADDPDGVLRRTEGGDLVAFEGHDALVELDHSRPATRRLVTDAMRHWLDRGADSWRLDAAYRVPLDFWAAVLPDVRAAHPGVWFEAEVIHGDYAAFVTEGTVDSVTQYELWKAVRSSIQERNLFELAWSLTRHNEFLEVFAPVTFVGNHDVTRIASAITDPRHRPHALVLLALLGGTPALYAGDEFGWEAVKEERAGGDDAIRPEFPADGPAAVSGSGERVLRLHQELLGLRRRHPWLHRARTDEPRTLANEHLEIDVILGSDRLTVALNLGDETFPLTPGELLSADDGTRGMPGRLAPHGWAVVAPR
nr:alpha-amylase family glycosyl hydrolase [Microbacterium lemovicicum]